MVFVTGFNELFLLTVALGKSKNTGRLSLEVSPNIKNTRGNKEMRPYVQLSELPL